MGSKPVPLHQFSQSITQNCQNIQDVPNTLSVFWILFLWLTFQNVSCISNDKNECISHTIQILLMLITYLHELNGYSSYWFVHSQFDQCWLNWTLINFQLAASFVIWLQTLLTTTDQQMCTSIINMDECIKV